MTVDIYPQSEVVILRRFKDDGSVIALFPNDRDGIWCNSYMRVGQHAPAQYSGVISQTIPAHVSESDTAALVAELRRIGYVPIIRQRRPAR